MEKEDKDQKKSKLKEGAWSVMVNLDAVLMGRSYSVRQAQEYHTEETTDKRLHELFSTGDPLNDTAESGSAGEETPRFDVRLGEVGESLGRSRFRKRRSSVFKRRK